jgi:RNA polymerase sigma-70 factor (ECF subfamily)
MSEIDLEFEEHRQGLERLAYRMLGSLADADDVLQDAYLRWSRSDRAEVHSARAYLYSIVTRLCIDQRRKVEARKESYIGPWLPDPVIESEHSHSSLEAAESISLAFLVVLESLSPVERAAYLLRRVFDYEYDQIAEVLDKSPTNCRQLVSRSEERIHERRPRFEPDPDAAERITGEFLEACTTGDLDGLVGLLAADAVAYTDGGGKATAAMVPIHGSDRIARMFIGLARKAGAEFELHTVRVNGQPGIMALHHKELAFVMTLDIVERQIANCYVFRNPDKLARMSKPDFGL